MVEVNYFDNLTSKIGKLEKYYNKVISSNESTAQYARKIILDRVYSGKTTNGITMKYGGKNAFGVYSQRHGKARRSASLTTNTMQLNFTGKLFRNFTYRKSFSAKAISLRFYIRNVQIQGKDYTYPRLADDLQDRFNDPIFYPSVKEVAEIRKYYRKSVNV